jgi:hypothetical protein
MAIGTALQIAPMHAPIQRLPRGSMSLVALWTATATAFQMIKISAETHLLAELLISTVVNETTMRTALSLP